MSATLLFAPHNDDETLFAFYQCFRHRPHVVVVFRSFLDAERGGAKYYVREKETDCAMKIAGCTWEQWSFPDNRPVNEHDLAVHMREAVEPYRSVIAPAWERDGHEHHNMVALIAAGLELPLLRYFTYKRGQGRTRGPIEVYASEEERALKLEALGCYQSQIAWPATEAWFPGGDFADLREWVV